MHELIIVGAGPAGLTAAIYAARANLEPLVLQGPLPGGQLTTTTEVENFPGFPEGIMGAELMTRMEDQAKRFGAVLKEESVTRIEKQSDGNFLVSSEEGVHQGHAVILASGANPRYLEIPGERELLGYGVSTCATCDGAFFRNKIIAVVGGGDSACEEANFLTRFGSKVYMIHRRSALRASKIMADRVLANPKIEMIWDSVVTEVVGTKESGVQFIKLKNIENSSESRLETSALFVAIGHTPNSQVLGGAVQLDDNGYVLQIKSGSTVTSIDGLFVCGDVQDSVFRQAITAAGSGCMAAIEAERYLEAMSTTPETEN